MQLDIAFFVRLCVYIGYSRNTWKGAGRGLSAPVTEYFPLFRQKLSLYLLMNRISFLSGLFQGIFHSYLKVSDVLKTKGACHNCDA